MSESYKFTLSEETKIYAEKVLNETEERRQSALEEIRTFLKENPELNARSDDWSILPFLRGCKFNMEKTKTKLRNFYIMRAERVEWFSNRDPTLPVLQELVKLGVFLPLPKLLDNKLVVIIKTSAHNPKKHQFNDVLKTGKMILDIACKENEMASIYGVTAILDMKGASLGHALQLTPSAVKNAVYAWQNYHCRPQQLEFVSAPLYVNVVLNLFKKFMNEKLKKRVRVHFAGLNGLHKIVPKDILPLEYGGSDCKLDDLINYWNNKLLEYKEWFQEDEKYKADLSLIP